MARDEDRIGSPVNFDPKEPERDEGGALPDHAPDAWAPINRTGEPMRDDVDRFRNERVAVPTTLGEAFEALALALELYETAREVEREASSELAEHLLAEPEVVERAIGALLGADPKAPGGESAQQANLDRTGGRSAASRTAAEKLVDLVPEVAAFHAATYRLRERKERAAKEVSVARRRHDTCKIFAERFEVVHIAERVAPYLGDVHIDGGRMTADEVRAAVADTAARRGGWREYPSAPNTGADVERAAERATESHGVRVGESITLSPEMIETLKPTPLGTLAGKHEPSPDTIP